MTRAGNLRLSTALVLLLGLLPSLAAAASVEPYVDAGASNKRGEACFATADTNAAVHVLAGFLAIWTPRSPFVDAGQEAPAKDGCAAVAKTDWDGIPMSATDGRVVNAAIHAANIDYVVKATRARTADQAFAAYLDDRRGKNASIVDGLGALADAWKAGTHQTTTITEVAADATTVKYDDKGNNRGFGSKPDEKAKTPANPDLGLAVDLINAASDEASTEPAKRYFKYARPYRWSRDVVVVPSLMPARSDKPTEDGGFPSGHTAEAWRDALTMAYLVPQRFQEMVTRAAEMGENRILAGMHSPLDVMGGRLLATAQVTYNLNKPANAELKTQAFGQVQAWLAQHSGIDSPAGLYAVAHSLGYGDDRFADYASNRQFFDRTMSYDFQPIAATDRPASVPKGAEVLLETRLPYLDAAQRRDVLRTTAIASGMPLLDDPEGYGRLNLFAAADGFGAFDTDVAVTMEEAKGGFFAIDSWRNDISGKGSLTKRGDGTLGLAGINTFAGGTVVEAGSLVALSPSAVGTGRLSVIGGGLIVAADEALLVDGGFAQEANGALTLRLGDQPAAGRMTVKGEARLAGRLTVTLPEFDAPKPGDVITLLTADTVAGTFATVVVEGGNGTVGYSGKAVTLTIGG